MATTIITTTATELLNAAVVDAGRGHDASAIAERIGTVDRETYLGLRGAWKIAYALKTEEIRRHKRDRAAPAPAVDASLPDAERDAAKKVRAAALSRKDSANNARQSARGDARELMEVHGALKEAARAHRAAKTSVPTA